MSYVFLKGLCLCNRHQYSSNGTMSPGAVGDCSYFSGTPESSLQRGEFHTRCRVLSIFFSSKIHYFMHYLVRLREKMVPDY
jgi:hypothetical protein